jgi:hypothetical protein
MRRTLIGLSVLGLWAVTALPAPAAWNNVFQPTLFHRNRPATVSQYYVPPTVVAAASPCDTCQPCPQTTCTTRYIQRCFYQPVTCMQTQTYYEPVTTYRTSYYYEQVTSYTYSCYFDPCTCSYQKVATPCTSLQLRSQCCPVQSWVQRCCQVPVTTYQKSCYWQPQTTCCTTTPGAMIPATPQVPVMPPSVIQQPPATQPPSVIQQPPGEPTAPSITNPGQSAYPPSVYEQKAYGTGNPPTPPAPPVMPPASLKAPLPPVPPLKLEGIAMAPNSRLDATVVHNDRTPQANARVMFRGTQTGQVYFTTSNTAGNISVQLPSGTYLVYLYGADDVPTLSTQLQIRGSQVPVAMR